MSSNNKTIRQELDQLVRDGLLDEDTYRSLRTRYPTDSWNWRVLGRYFLIIGVLLSLAGAAILVYRHLNWSLEMLALRQFITLVLAFGLGIWLNEKEWTWTGRSLQLLGGLIIVGFTFTVAAIVVDEPGTPEPLILFNAGLTLAIAYGLSNPLLLIESLVLVFFGMGGVGGYFPEVYWLGINFPLRFLAVGSTIVAIGVIHHQGLPDWLPGGSGFAKIWLSLGILYAELSLWLISIFGLYGSIDTGHQESWGVVLLFNALWALVNCVLVILGQRLRYKMLTGYGVTFLTIQIYTKYFEHLILTSNDPLEGFFLLLLLGLMTIGAIYGLNQYMKFVPSMPNSKDPS